MTEHEIAAEARYQDILDKRARALAAVPSAAGQRRLAQTVALVKVGAETFGVPVDGLREIVRAPPLTPLPGLPAWLPGILHLRGEVLCAVHLGQWFAIADPRPAQYLVVLDGAEFPLGLLVSAVAGFRDVHEDEFASGLGEAETTAARRPISRTTRDLVSILDLPTLVKNPDLRIAAGASPPSTVFAG
ncbi:MAG TPA: chemotaxis protein CheW [Myxococcales bacterium]|jgi:purine-binding chemotaxis protein CheW